MRWDRILLNTAVEQRDGDEAAQVGRQRRPHALPELIDLRAPGGADEAKEPAPHAVAVLYEEERDDKRDGRARDELSEDDRSADHAAADLPGVVAHAVGGIVDCSVDLSLAHAERALR